MTKQDTDHVVSKNEVRFMSLLNLPTCAVKNRKHKKREVKQLRNNKKVSSHSHVIVHPK